MTHDFFLSYACQDNEQIIPGRAESEWVTTFHGILRNRLQYYLGRRVEIFFDRGDLSGNSALTPEIETALDNSHLFVAISSPTYYNRPWCKMERSRFIQRLGPSPGSAKRVFVIHTIDTDPDHPNAWQAEFFPDLRGYIFYREDQAAASRMETLGSPLLEKGSFSEQEYFREINGLAQDMAKRIRDLTLNSSPTLTPSAPSVPQPNPPEMVYLAENALRSHNEREELRAALRDAGFQVGPLESLAGKPAEQLAAVMARAMAFVQVVSPMLLEIPGSQGVTYDELQLEAARGAGLPLFRWRALDLDIGAAALNFPRYTEFATSADVRQQLLPNFKEEMINALKDLRAQRRVKQAAKDDERMVLITGDSADLESHSAVVTSQLEQHALGHYITDSPVEEIQAPDVRGFVVLYGRSSAEWVRDRLKIVRSLPKPRQRELKVAVYFCEPPPDLGTRRLLFDMPSFQKIRWDDQPSLDAFASTIGT